MHRHLLEPGVPRHMYVGRARMIDAADRWRDRRLCTPIAKVFHGVGVQAEDADGSGNLAPNFSVVSQGPEGRLIFSAKSCHALRHLLCTDSLSNRDVPEQWTLLDDSLAAWYLLGCH